MLLQKYHDRNGRCIAILFKVSGSGVDLTLLIEKRALVDPGILSSAGAGLWR